MVMPERSNATTVFATAILFFVTLVPANSVLEEAKRLTLAGVSDEAVTEYKRYLFFNPDSPAVAVYLLIAELYRDMGQLDNAQHALQSALAAAACDSLRDAIRIEKSIIEIVQRKYGTAQMELLRIASFSAIPSLRDRAGLFLCIACISAGEWDKALEISSKGAASGDRSLCRIDSLLKKSPRFSRKSPAAAKWMSTFLPGLGQGYAHDLPDGLNALAITAAAGFMTVHSIVYGYYQEAVFTDITLFWRYYNGNRWHASEAVERYNTKRDRLFFNNVIDKILPGSYHKQ